jgi:hypothetical protein
MTPTAEDIRALHAKGIPLNAVCKRLGIGWRKMQMLLSDEVTRAEMPSWPRTNWERRAYDLQEERNRVEKLGNLSAMETRNIGNRISRPSLAECQADTGDRLGGAKE